MSTVSKTAQKYVESYDGVKIYYQVRANENPTCLVFLHGLGGSLAGWNPEIEFFSSKGISTIAIDLLGHGLSDRPTDPDRFHFNHQARDVVHVLGKEQFKNYILVGQCYGGLVAMTLAATFQNILKGLVVIDSSDHLPRYAKAILERESIQGLLSFLEKYFPNIYVPGRTNYQKYKGRGDWYFPRLFEDMMHTSLKSYLFSFQNVLGLNLQEIIKNISVPTLIIASEKDTIFPPELSKDIASRIKKSILTILPGEDHVVILNNPQKIDRESVIFLKKMKVIPDRKNFYDASALR